MRSEFECEEYGCLTRSAGASVQLGIRGKGRPSRLHFEEAEPDRHARADILADDNAALSRSGSTWFHVLDQPDRDDWAIERRSRQGGQPLYAKGRGRGACIERLSPAGRCNERQEKRASR